MNWLRRFFTDSWIVDEGNGYTEPPVPGNAVPPAAPPGADCSPPGRSASRLPPAPGYAPARETHAPPAPASSWYGIPRHGGHLKTIEIWEDGEHVKTVELWADGRMVATFHRTGQRELVPGYCADCAHVISSAVDALLRDMP